MRSNLKLWSGTGACMLIGAAAPSHAATGLLSAGAMSLQQTVSEGGEGGEGGGEAGGVVPSQYRLMLDPASDPVYDGSALAAAYAANVQRAYADAAQAARRLRAAVQRMLDAPSHATLAAARRAWIEARRPYLATEAFRFYEGPVDGPGSAGRMAGPEGRLNAWPLNEAVIDYVEGAPQSGLVNAVDVPITRDEVLTRDQVSDEADVTTGWHAIEFLLWGQDRDAAGPGARSVEDYRAGSAANERRRAYLLLLTEQLIADLDWLALQWRPAAEASYADEFLALEPHEAVGRMLTGAALLAGHELASERLAVGLDSGSQEDEQSCFSDSTWQDFAWGLAGIKRVYFGRGETVTLASTLQRLQPRLALEMEQRFADAERRLAALPDPFDRMLASAPGSRERAAGEAAIVALQRLAAGLRDSGRALGVLVIVPGV
jgi:putative iron-regulated protein